jgi:hypothetical protein
MLKKLSYAGGNSDRKNENEATVASAFGGSLESGGHLCVGESGLSRCENVFTLTNKNYKPCSFSSICEDNAEIKCIFC